MQRLLSFILVASCFGCASKSAKNNAALKEVIPEDQSIQTVLHGYFNTRYFVQVQIDGKPRSFLLDTGARKSILGVDDFSKKYKSDKNYQLSGAANSPSTCNLIYAEKLETGGQKYTHAPLFRCEGADDALGIDYFNRSIVSLNFQEAQFNFLKEVPSNLKMQPLERGPQGHLLVAATLDGFPVKALVDTGAGVSIVSTEFVQAHALTFRNPVADQNGEPLEFEMTVNDWAGHPLKGTLYVVQNLKVGGLEIPQLAVLAVQIEGPMKLAIKSPLVLGANAVAGLDWIFDLKNNQWAVTRPALKNELPHFNVLADEIIRTADSLDLNGTARIASAKNELHADHIHFDLVKKTMEAEGSVEWTVDEVVTKSDKMSFHVNADTLLPEKK